MKCTINLKISIMFKKILLFVAVLFTGASTMNGQIRQGDFAVGAQLSYGTGVEMVGAGAHARYALMDNLRAELAINYFFEGNWDANLNAEYLIGLSQNKLYLYPMVGLCLANLDTNLDDPTEARVRKFGFNLGGGLQFRVARDVDLFLEARRTIMSDIHQTVFAAGVTVTF